jgi:hypothetical protein
MHANVKKDAREFTVRVDGQLTFNNLGLTLDADYSTEIGKRRRKRRMLARAPTGIVDLAGLKGGVHQYARTSWRRPLSR